VWRYPPALVGATVRMGVEDVPGMAQHAVAAGMVLGRAWWDKAIDHAGNAVLGLEIAGGPVGVVVAEILDVVLAGAQWLLDFLDALERDAAAVATAFAPGPEQMGERLWGAGQAARLFGSVGLAAAPFVPASGLRKAISVLPDEVPALGARLDPKPAAALKYIPEHVETALDVQRTARRPTKLPALVRAGAEDIAMLERRIERAVHQDYEGFAFVRPTRGILPGTAGTGKIKIIGFKGRPNRDVVIHGEVEPGLLTRHGPKPGQLEAPEFNVGMPGAAKRPPELRDYQWAHLWGIRFGDEARLGMWLAHPSVNQGIQSYGRWDGIEARIVQIADAVRDMGGKTLLTVRARAFDDLPDAVTGGHSVLKEVAYSLTVIRSDGRTFTWNASLVCEPPPSKTPLKNVWLDGYTKFVEALHTP